MLRGYNKKYSFDVIFTFATIEHVPDPNKAFSEIDRVLCGGAMSWSGPLGIVALGQFQKLCCVLKQIYL